MKLFKNFNIFYFVIKLLFNNPYQKIPIKSSIKNILKFLVFYIKFVSNHLLNNNYIYFTFSPEKKNAYELITSGV